MLLPGELARKTLCRVCPVLEELQRVEELQLRLGMQIMDEQFFLSRGRLARQCHLDCQLVLSLDLFLGHLVPGL